MTPQRDVLIVGAGPTGLVLALWLTKLGIKPRIIDKTPEPVATSRAIGVQARTLELYRQLDLTPSDETFHSEWDFIERALRARQAPKAPRVA